MDYKEGTTAQGPVTQAGISYQLGQASFGEDSAWTVQVEVTRTPAAHVEPLHGAGRERPILLVEQDQLLLRSHRRALQHLLQLQRITHTKEWGVRYLLLPYQFNRILYFEIHRYTHTYIHLTSFPI